MIGIGDLVKGIFGEKGFVGSVVDILKSSGVLKDPEMILKAEQALYDYDTRIREIEAKIIESVNATMREEAKSNNRFVSSWRPICGYTLSFLIVNNYVLFPYFQAFGLAIPEIEVPVMVWSALLAVTGVAAWTRGQEKIEKVKNGKA